MLLVTGGAGFIGSNVVAALNDAGHADVAVCDVLGHGGKWAQSRQAPARGHRAAGAIAGMAEGPPARRRHPSRRHFGNHRYRTPIL